MELLRLRWRRAVLLLAAAAVLVPALVIGVTVYSTRPISEQDLRSAQAQADQDIANGLYDQDIQRCARRPARYGVTVDPGADDPEAQRAACEDALLPRAEFYLSRSSLDLTSQREYGAGITVAVLLTLLGALVGTTFAGHDWSSGSMSNQLLFEPRRTRVWLAKAVAVGVSWFGFSLVVTLMCWTVLWAFTAGRGEPIAPLAVQAGYKQALLAAALAAGAGVATYALTMLFRSTVATLGLLLALAVGSTLLLGALGLGAQVRLLPDVNVTAYLVGSVTRTDYESPECQTPTGRPPPGSDCVRTVDRGASVLYLGLLGCLAVVPSVLSFRRRDVG